MSLSKPDIVTGRVPCPNCEYLNRPGRITCKRCHLNLQDIEAEMMAREGIELPVLEVEERSAILDRTVVQYVEQGFRVMSRSDTTAQLVKPKQPSPGFIFVALVSLLFIWILPGFLVFLGCAIAYFLERDVAVYLEIDSVGRVQRR